MSILTDIFAFIGSFALSTISQLGYAGIFFLMMLESMIVPVPSEFVMPFAGFLRGIFGESPEIPLLT